MTLPNDGKGFFDRTEMDDLDKALADHMTQPTLIDQYQKARQEKKAKRRAHTLNFYDDVKRFWWLYLFLVVSSLFTGTLGAYMGMAPEKMQDPNNPALTVIYFHTDASHIFLAFVYGIAFVVCTEVAFAIFKWLYFTREEETEEQAYASIAGMFIAGASMLGTGIAGGKVIASNIAFLSDFVNIPASAQTWVVIAIPTLIVSYAVIGTIYVLSSAQAASERIARESKRTSELNQKTRMEGLTQVGEYQLQKSQLVYYMKAIEAGKLTYAEAKGAMLAGKTLGVLETEMGKDLDDSGVIGDEPDFSKPVPAHQKR